MRGISVPACMNCIPFTFFLYTCVLLVYGFVHRLLSSPRDRPQSPEEYRELQYADTEYSGINMINREANGDEWREKRTKEREEERKRKKK